MTASAVQPPPAQRREPVQERSRQTVARILDAAEAIVDEAGIDAVTTRAVSSRAGVAAPSLYRFFRDREEILDRVLERHLVELEALSAQVEPTWDVRSAADLLNAEFDLHIDYYRRHPSAARLWMGGRASTTVIEKVHARMRAVAQRMHDTLTTLKLIDVAVEQQAFLVATELADRVLELAWRERDDFDEALLEHGRAALISYMERLATRP